MARGDGRGFRGRGRGRGRGGEGGGGGGGGYRGGRGGGGAMRMPGSSMLKEDLEFNIRMFADAPPNASGSNTPRGGRGVRGGQFSGPNSGSTTPNRGRGRGRGSGYDSPRGRGGYDSPRGSGRGRGGPPDSFSGGRRGEFGIGSSPRGRGGGPQRRPDTLSGLLYQERPFLRPIKFVPSVLTKVLFEEEEKEELLKPGVEEVDETERSHVPTADQVFRVFSGGNIPRMDSDSEDDGDEDQEEIEEVDFDEVEKLFNPTSELKTTTIRKSKLAETTIVVEQQFTGFYIDKTPATSTESDTILPDQPKEETIDVDVDNLTRMVEETLSTTDEQPNADDVDMSAPHAEESALEATEEIPLAPTQPETIAIEPEQDLFCIDVQPSSVPESMAPSGDHLPSALRDEEDDDIIVYVAPHPRKADSQNDETAPTSKAQPSEEMEVGEAPPHTSHFQPYIRPATLPTTLVASSSSTYVPSANTPTISSLSFSFTQKQTWTTTPGKASTRLLVPPVSTPRQAKAWKRKRGVAKKGRMKSSFGAFGAMREEAMLHKGDPRRNQRRRGDSDLEWGDSDDEGGEVDEVEEGLEDLVGWKTKSTASETTHDNGKGKGKARDDEHGMDVDPDLAPGMAAMRSFVGGLLGKNAGQHTTMDDLRVAEMIRMEDEEDDDSHNDDDGEDSSEDESEEDVLAMEEAMLISESLEFDDELDGSDSDDDSDGDDEEDEDKTPRTSFQARLERLREKARSKKTGDTSLDQMEEDESDEDKEDFIKRNMTWADEDEDFIQEIQDILDDNEEALKGNDRKTRNAIFKSIRDGDFEDLGPARKRKDKGKGLPAELQEVWDRDRKKKAEYKEARELARLENAADPLSKKKGGKKGRKAMLAAAKLDPTITVIPNRIIDMVTLVQQIRRFIVEIGGPISMSLPPTNKETRKNIHEMAIAFNLKSLSKGKNDSRYTTLTKTSKTGFRTDEAKIAKIVRRSGGMGARGDSFIYDKKGKGPPAAMPRHREGEEVGKAAPKLTESNVGFRMLAMMGWAEGARIGFTGGLDAPLTAIIKHTKLGLGATK